MRQLFKNRAKRNNIRMIILAMFLGTFSLLNLACTTNTSNNNTDDKNSHLITKDNIPQICTIFIDGTGSYKSLAKAKRTALNKILSLPAGSKVYVRWITNNSNSDECSIVSLIIPEKPKKPSNPFANPKEKRDYKIKIMKYKQLFTRLVDRIQKMNSPNAGYTDIWGAVFAASERFKHNNNYQAQLIMMTDMVDNVNKRYNDIDLKNAVVQILDYQVDPYEDGRKELWEKRLTSIGASTVQFVFLDEIITFND